MLTTRLAFFLFAGIVLQPLPAVAADTPAITDKGMV